MKTYSEPVLYTPGPSTVPQRVLNAYARPVIHHRTKEMSDILGVLEEKLQWLFNTKQPVLPLHVTGRGALEATILNLLSPGDEIISICNGRFATMCSNIAATYGITVHRICTSWERNPDLSELEEAIRQHPRARAVTMCHNESSTSVMQPIEPVAAIASAHGLLTFVDSVSSLGGIRVDFDSCGADVVVTASQKCLMCTPGMSFAVLSDRAWNACKEAKLPKFFTNYEDIRKLITNAHHETPGSTPVSEVYGLVEALTMMQEEGRDAIFERHTQNANAVRTAVRALGMQLFPLDLPDAYRSNTLTAFYPLPGINANDLKQSLEQEYGLKLAAGMGDFKGQILRIGHMGYCFRRDIITLISCLEAYLYQKGAISAPGAGVAASLKAFC